MFVVPTHTGPSPIHGVGVFAGAPIPQGRVIWRYIPTLDRRWAPGEATEIPPEVRALIGHHVYKLAGCLCYDADNARYTNHSDTPNTRLEGPDTIVATVDIAAGEELTIDYWSFEQDWEPEEFLTQGG